MEAREMKERVDTMMSGIPFQQKREVIAKSRWTCDSHWMMAMVANSGWDVANQMNGHVARTVGHVEMQRLMKTFGLKKPMREDEFRFLVTLAMEAFITKDYMEYGYEHLEPYGDIAVIYKCYAYTKIHSIGMDKEYVCGCGALREGWYQAMGVSVRERLLKCLKHGDDRCEIFIESMVFPS